MADNNDPAFMPLIPGMRSCHYEQMTKPHFRRGQLLERMSIGKLTSTEKMQSAPATAFRSSRVRRVVVCFYLSDRSISISEPRVANSGISQGEFMRRTVARKSGNKSNSLPRENISDDFYSPEDFRIGGELRLYGRIFHIVDCDAATRSFYSEALGETLASPRMYPDESRSRMDEVDELKNTLRVRTRALGASKAEATRKFHDLSQKVLRFYASWHDDHPLYPETRHFVIHYYLCDDTVEIVEARDRNRERGRGQFGVLLSRRKLAREPRTGKRQQNDDNEETYFITDRDLRCEKFEPPTLETPQTAPKWKLFQAAQPPQPALASNGRGTSGYSANNNNSCMQGGLVAPIPGGQSCGRSFVTPLCRDDDLDGKQLRFRARFQGLPRGDMNAQREFVVTYFLEDETLAVFEPRVRNSGVLGGRFLDRARFRKYPKLSNTTGARDGTVPMHYQASDMYSHLVTLTTMKNVMGRAGFTSSMNEQQVITLFRRFASDPVGFDNNQVQEPLFAYDDFCDILAALVNKPPTHEERGDPARSISSKLMKIPRRGLPPVMGGLTSIACATTSFNYPPATRKPSTPRISISAWISVVGETKPYLQGRRVLLQQRDRNTTQKHLCCLLGKLREGCRLLNH
ncbi:hypothetical protein PHYSODRAFT_486787 [Phytophthora sojae]|uniref:DM10 domain-containing protein n=1 Tax=Phytophthora sojae (strain P6497) TaxID=1094619 RepID=G4YVW8_PHYSP|nr:hypothetical protein PHYSODRAFT_486787 [Phytophthora sojae]EGZ23722.1 hypothetical protein PHYSODRAFT_486787 [Phytophthora sojae]|eukprot:XP_009519010.1 hypothetical protein PHYSODRAFT_486787 [Phytophthora sojae]